MIVTNHPLPIAELRAHMRPRAKIAAIGLESRLIEDLAIDALDFVALDLKIQNHFDVVIDYENVPDLPRIADLAAHLAAGMESIRLSNSFFARAGCSAPRARRVRLNMARRVVDGATGAQHP